MNCAAVLGALLLMSVAVMADELHGELDIPEPMVFEDSDLEAYKLAGQLT